MSILSTLRRLWPRSERALTDSFAHPAEQMITPEIKRYLENHNWRNLRYPPYQEGYPGLVSGQWFMRNYQRELYDRIMNSVGLPANELQVYLEPILVNFAELAHMLPASENHHHSGPGGLLRHSLEVASLTLDGCLTTAFDSNETPARRSMRLRRWYVAGIASGLLHDAGKPLTDIRATDFEGNNQWIYAQETLHDWSARHKLSRYFLHWNSNRHGNHVQVSVAQATRIIPPAVQAWLIEGGHDIYEAMLDAISGNGTSPLTELVKCADAASSKRDLNRGSTNGSGSATGVPVPRLVADAMLRLISNGTWAVNTPGGRVWVATDGLYISWNQGAEEIVDMLVRDGVVAIPRSPDTLIGTLVDHGMAQRAPNGELYWLVTPHLLRKNGKGPALRCLKLTNPDILFPTNPIPSPVSISLGKEGKQKEVIAPNDSAGAAANEISEHQKDLFGADLSEDSSDQEQAEKVDKPKPAVKASKKKKTDARQSAPVPATPSAGVALKGPSTPTEVPAEVDTTVPVPDSGSAEPAASQPEEDEDQGEAAEPEFALDEMLLFMSGRSPAEDSEPNQPASAGEPNEAAIEEVAVSRPDLLHRQEKISLNSILGQGKRQPKATVDAKQGMAEQPVEPKQAKAEQPAQSTQTTAEQPVEPTQATSEQPIEPNEATTAQPIEPKQAAMFPSDNPQGDCLEKLSAHEQYLLSQYPDLAKKLVNATRDPDNAAQAKGKVFVVLGPSTFVAEDIRPLVNAGWLWQDFTVDGPALTRTLQKREGFLLNADLSVIYCKLAGYKEWSIPHISSLPEADVPTLQQAVSVLIEKATLEEIGGSPTFVTTTYMVANIATRYGVTAISLENAVFCLRDAVKNSKHRKIYVRAHHEEIPQK